MTEANTDTILLMHRAHALAFNAGRDARLAGLGVNANPYAGHPGELAMAASWDEGWISVDRVADENLGDC